MNRNLRAVKNVIGVSCFFYSFRADLPTINKQHYVYPVTSKNVITWWQFWWLQGSKTLNLPVISCFVTWIVGHRCPDATKPPEECPAGYFSSAKGQTACTEVSNILKFLQQFSNTPHIPFSGGMVPRALFASIHCQAHSCVKTLSDSAHVTTPRWINGKQQTVGNTPKIPGR